MAGDGQRRARIKTSPGGEATSAVYAGRHAAYYDLFYGDKPYDVEARRVAELFASEGPCRVLDVACGTGRHAAELAKLGYQVVGVDLSWHMLLAARRRVSTEGLAVPFSTQDMRSLAFKDAAFDGVVCLFDSIGYALSSNGVLQALSAFRRVLSPTGCLVMEFWHAPAMESSFEPVRVRRWNVPDGEVVRISETTLLEDESAASVEYTVLELRDDGSYERFSETHVNRYFTLGEMDDLLRRAGLRPIEWFDRFDTSGPTDETWHVLVVAEPV